MRDAVIDASLVCGAAFTVELLKAITGGAHKASEVAPEDYSLVVSVFANVAAPRDEADARGGVELTPFGAFIKRQWDASKDVRDMQSLVDQNNKRAHDAEVQVERLTKDLAIVREAAALEIRAAERRGAEHMAETASSCVVGPMAKSVAAMIAEVERDRDHYKFLYESAKAAH